MPTYWSGNTVVGSSGGEAAGASTYEYSKAAKKNYEKTGEAFQTSSVLGLAKSGQLYIAETTPTAAPTDAERIARNPAVVTDPSFHDPTSDFQTVTEQTGSSGESGKDKGMLDSLLSGAAIPIVIIIIAIVAVIAIFKR